MISKKDVQHIAKLARIELSEKETEKFQKDLSAVLDYFELLEEVNTEKVKPTFHPSEHYFKENVTRKDQALRDDSADVLIDSAPAKKGRHIKVKAVFK